jgi:four helix bundle protein
MRDRGGIVEATFEEWQETVPTAIRADALWAVAAFRKATYLADIAWEDVSCLGGDRRTWALSDQLCRAVGSIGANIAEGYSRGSRRDRTRFYEYALGSAREARTWYFNGRFILGEEVVARRLEIFSDLIRLLLTMVGQQRGVTVSEPPTAYTDPESPIDPDIHPSA